MNQTACDNLKAKAQTMRAQTVYRHWLRIKPGNRHTTHRAARRQPEETG